MSDLDDALGQIASDAAQADPGPTGGGVPSVDRVRDLVSAIASEPDRIRGGERVDRELLPLIGLFGEGIRASLIDLVAAQLPWMPRAAVQRGVNRLVRESAPKPAPQPGPDPATGEPYTASGGRMYRLVRGRDGAHYQEIANFVARLLRQVIVDNGVERTSHAVLGGEMCDGRVLSEVRIPSADWATLKWLGRAWGPTPSISADSGADRHVRAAIQYTSGTSLPVETVHARTGWIRMDAGWAFLHRTGAVGADGLVTTVSVELPASLQPCELPAPPDGDALVAAIRASLRVLVLAPLRITAPVYAAVWRAVIPVLPDYVLAVVGRTTSGKSEIVARGQQHFGAGFSRLNLPGNWLSTGNALEGGAFAAMHLFHAIDDLVHTGTRTDREQKERELDRLVRSVGNHAGRDRCNPDGSLKGGRPPRGLVVITAEDLPPARQSAHARMFTIDVGKDDTDWDAMTQAQADGAAGRFAEAMSGFLRWLSPRLDEVVAGFAAGKDRIARQVADLGPMMRRTPQTCGDLLVGLGLFLEFAEEAGAVTAVERATVLDACTHAVAEVATDQGRAQAASDPVNRFLAVLLSAFVTGRAHLVSTGGSAPDPSIAEAWGWRLRKTGTGQFANDEWTPTGNRVGWLDPNGEDVYLEPEASYALVQELTRNVGDGLSIGRARLGKALFEAGRLVQTELATHRCYTVRKVVPGAVQPRVPVLWLKAGTFTDPSWVAAGSSGSTETGTATHEIRPLIQGLLSSMDGMGSKGSKEEGTRTLETDCTRDHDPYAIRVCVPSETLPMLPTGSNSTDEQGNPWVAPVDDATPATHGTNIECPEFDEMLGGGEA